MRSVSTLLSSLAAFQPHDSWLLLDDLLAELWERGPPAESLDLLLLCKAPVIRHAYSFITQDGWGWVSPLAARPLYRWIGGRVKLLPTRSSGALYLSEVNQIKFS